MITTKEQAYEFFKFLCNTTGIDLEALLFAEKNEPSTIGAMFQKRELFEIYRLYMSGEYDRAVNASADFLKECISNLRMKEFDAASLEEVSNFYLKASQWINFYDQFAIKDRAEWMQLVKSIPLLTESERVTIETEQSDHRDLNEVEKTLKDMPVRRYAGTGNIPIESEGFVVTDAFVMCDNLSNLLSGLKTPDDDHIHITVMLKLDHHLWMSYFIIAIQYHDNTWLADDGYSYANPQAKEGIAGRGSARIREEVINNSILPYEWLNWIDEQRTTHREMVRNGIHTGELYIKQITQDWAPKAKICSYLLFGKLIEKVIIECPTQEINTVSAFAMRNSKLLTNGCTTLVIKKDNLDKEFECESLHEQCQTYVDELYIPQRDNTSIVRLSTDDIIKKLDGNNTLCTAKQYRELVAWSVKENERIQLQTGLNTLTEDIEKQRNRLCSMIENNLPNILPYLYYGDNVYYIFDDPKYHSFSNSIGGRTIYPFTGNYWSYGMRRIGADLCPNCKSHTGNTKRTIGISVIHYRQLMWLCGTTDRNKLPPYYRNFMRHDLIPYHGNTLLDNVNPIYTIKDPCSAKHSNGFGINVHLCGYCMNRLKKQHWKGETVYLHFSLNKTDITGYEIK